MLAIHLVGKFASADTLSRAKNKRNFIDSAENRRYPVPFREFAQTQFPFVSPFNSVYPFICDALFVRDAPIFLNAIGKRITRLSSRERFVVFANDARFDASLPLTGVRYYVETGKSSGGEMPAKRYAVVAVVRILTIAANRRRSCVPCVRFRYQVRRGATRRTTRRFTQSSPRLSSFSRSEANFR